MERIEPHREKEPIALSFNIPESLGRSDVGLLVVDCPTVGVVSEKGPSCAAFYYDIIRSTISGEIQLKVQRSSTSCLNSTRLLVVDMWNEEVRHLIADRGQLDSGE